MTKKTYSALLMIGILVSTVAAQGLSPSVRKPIADGILDVDEYSYSGTYSGMKLGASLSADRGILYLALTAPTTGWVAIGIGSLKMNGAFMVLGSVANGNPVVSEETGAGFGHRPNTGKKLIASALRESGGTTILEIALPTAAYIAGNTVQLILAYGAGDNTRTRHSGRTSVELPMLK